MLSAPKDLRDKIVAPESAAAEAMLAAGTASALEVTSLALLCGRGNLARSGLKPGRKFHNPFSLPVGVWHADATSLGDQIERNHSITCNAGLAEPKLKAKLSDLGGTVLGGPPTDFGMLLAEETEKWAKVVKFANVKAE